MALGPCTASGPFHIFNWDGVERRPHAVECLDAGDPPPRRRPRLAVPILAARCPPCPLDPLSADAPRRRVARGKAARPCGRREAGAAEEVDAGNDAGEGGDEGRGKDEGDDDAAEHDERDSGDDDDDERDDERDDEHDNERDDDGSGEDERDDEHDNERDAENNNDERGHAATARSCAGISVDCSEIFRDLEIAVDRVEISVDGIESGRVKNAHVPNTDRAGRTCNRGRRTCDCGGTRDRAGIAGDREGLAADRKALAADREALAGGREEFAADRAATAVGRGGITVVCEGAIRGKDGASDGGVAKAVRRWEEDGGGGSGHDASQGGVAQASGRAGDGGRADACCGPGPENDQPTGHAADCLVF